MGRAGADPGSVTINITAIADNAELDPTASPELASIAEGLENANNGGGTTIAELVVDGSISRPSDESGGVAAETIRREHDRQQLWRLAVPN